MQWNVPNAPFPGGSNAFFASAEGHRLPHTPDWTANLGAAYVLQTSIGEWKVDGNFVHDSGWYGEPDNSLSQYAPPRTYGIKFTAEF